MELEKIVLIKKPTRLEEMLKRHATTSQIKFYLESRNESYGLYKDEHDAYLAGFEQTLSLMPKSMRLQIINRELLTTHQFAEKDIVVVVGDAGLFVNVAKYVSEQPVIVVNPDQKRIDDVFTSCTPKTFPEILSKTLDGKISIEKLTMAEACLEDGQIIYGLNDIFIGRNSHVSARYELHYNGNSERQSSSGIIVATGSGSTGWLTSAMVGAYAITSGTSYPADKFAFPRGADYLKFIVREPFPSITTGAKIVQGRISARNPLKVVSNIPIHGVIFSDGIEEDYLDFNAGKIVTVKPALKQVHLVKQY